GARTRSRPASARCRPRARPAHPSRGSGDDPVDVDADALVALGVWRHSPGTAQLAAPPLGDGLRLADVLLPPARHADDLVDPAYADLVDTQVDDQVDRGRHGGHH